MPGYFDPALAAAAPAAGSQPASLSTDSQWFQVNFEGRWMDAAEWERTRAELARRWPGRPLPPDPDPDNGTIRVFDNGRWMAWSEWQRTAPVVIGPPEPDQNIRASKPERKPAKSQNHARQKMLSGAAGQCELLLKTLDT